MIDINLSNLDGYRIARAIDNLFHEKGTYPELAIDYLQLEALVRLSDKIKLAIIESDRKLTQTKENDYDA